MEFFEKVGGIISTKGKAAADKAKELAEIANLKGQIGSCEEVIRKNYLELGKAYYVAHKEEENEYIQAIGDAQKAIADLRCRIRVLKGTLLCAECGEELPAGTVFCPKCGRKVEEQEDMTVVKESDIVLPKTQTSEDGPAREFMEERLLEDEFADEQ